MIVKLQPFWYIRISRLLLPAAIEPKDTTFLPDPENIGVEILVLSSVVLIRDICVFDRTMVYYKGLPVSRYIYTRRTVHHLSLKNI